jgi:hypothetical protein
MQKNIYIDNIERTFASTGNEKFVLISGKEKFQFWGTEQGADSTPKKQFMALGVAPKMSVMVEYLEEPESFVNKDGKTVNWTKRSVRGIFPAEGTLTPPTPETPHHVPSTPPQRQGNAGNDDFGRRLAIHGFVNGLLAAGALPETIDIQALIRLEDRVNEALAGKVDELDQEFVKDIPF